MASQTTCAGVNTGLVKVGLVLQPTVHSWHYIYCQSVCPKVGPVVQTKEGFFALIKNIKRFMKMEGREIVFAGSALALPGRGSPTYLMVRLLLLIVVFYYPSHSIDGDAKRSKQRWPFGSRKGRDYFGSYSATARSP